VKSGLARGKTSSSFSIFLWRELRVFEVNVVWLSAFFFDGERIEHQLFRN